jgi:hypothetical protein
LAGLADFINIRVMYLSSAILLLGGGILVMVLPGLRQNKLEWRKALSLLRSAPVNPALGSVRAATQADMDALIKFLPSFAALSAKERSSFIKDAQVFEVSEGSTILRHGETGDSAFFLLAGRAVAGVSEAPGSYRSLSTMGPGDFFGEIAALTGVTRTADVVAAENANLMQVPAKTLRGLMANPDISALFLGKMAERLSRTNINELPRFAGVDQQDALELRTVPAAE